MADFRSNGSLGLEGGAGMGGKHRTAACWHSQSPRYSPQRTPEFQPLLSTPYLKIKTDPPASESRLSAKLERLRGLGELL